MQFDKPFKTMNGWIRNKVYSQIEQLHKSNMKSRQVFTVENNSQDKLDAGIFLDFNLNTGDDVMVRTGISLVSIDNARLNLEEEIARPFGWNFDKVVTNQQDTWKYFPKSQYHNRQLPLKAKILHQSLPFYQSTDHLE